MNRSFRSTLILLAVFLVLLVYILATHGKERKDREHPGIIKFSLGDIVDFTVVNQVGRLDFKRQGNDWSAPALPDLAMSKREIDSWLSDLRDMKSLKELKDPVELSQYGLDKTNLYVVLRKKGSSDRLIAGSRVASGSGFYLMYNGRIYIAEIEALDLFHRNIVYFRDKRVLAFRADEVTRIRVEGRSGGPYELRRSGKEWIVLQPKGRVVAGETVSTFLFELEEMETRDFIEGGTTDPAYYGFPSGYKLILRTGRSNEEAVIEFGKKTEQGYYASLNGNRKSILLLDPYFAEPGMQYLLDNLSPLKMDQGVTNEIE